MIDHMKLRQEGKTMRILKMVFTVVAGVLLVLGGGADAWAQATDVVCTGCVASTDLADGGVANADLATSAVSSVKIADGAIVNADISTAAAIAGTKVAPNFGSQNVVTTGSVGIGTATPNAASKLEVAGRIFAGGLIDRDTVGGSYYGLDPSSATIAGIFNGSVGIGTTSPGQKLSVAGTIESTLGGFKFPDGSVQTSAASGSTSAWTASGTNIYNANTGNVGIGTASPFSPLTIKTKGSYSLLITNALDTQTIFKVMEDTNGSGFLDLMDPNGAGLGMRLRAKGNSFFTDNVGIGTTGPGAKLELAGDGAGSSPAKIILRETQSGLGALFLNSVRVSSGNRLDIGEGSDTFLTVRSDADSGGTTSPGNVGIGTTTPNMPLVIKGDGSANAVGFNDAANVQRGSIFVSSATLGLNASTKLYLTANGLGITVDTSGNVGIGTTDPGAYKLAVKGKIHAEEVVVDTGWADFVFKKDYDLMPLEKVARHIEEKGHLPGIPTEREVKENGVSIGQIQSKLLQKIEEMTLYVIDLKKENEQLKERISLLENKSL